jgi:hypothetical protein
VETDRLKERRRIRRRGHFRRDRMMQDRNVQSLLCDTTSLYNNIEVEQITTLAISLNHPVMRNQLFAVTGSELPAFVVLRLTVVQLKKTGPGINQFVTSPHFPISRPE